MHIHLFCTHGALFGTHHKIETVVYILKSRNYTILTGVYNRSQFSFLGKFYISMALIFSLAPGFCEGRNISEPLLNSFCPLNLLSHLNSCGIECYLIWSFIASFSCTIVSTSLPDSSNNVSQGQINSAKKKSVCSKDLMGYCGPNRWLILAWWVPEIFLQSYAYLFISLLLKCYCQPLDERQIFFI